MTTLCVDLACVGQPKLGMRSVFVPVSSGEVIAFQGSRGTTLYLPESVLQAIAEQVLAQKSHPTVSGPPTN